MGGDDDPSEWTWPAVPDKPKPKRTWQEEKNQMREVIKKQEQLLQSYRDQNLLLRKTADALKKKLEKQEKPVENIQSEFTDFRKEDLRFSDIGGLGDVIEKVKNFENGITYPEMYEVYGIKPPRGLLVHGPPGCGKTMLAKAISNELDCYFLNIPITRVISEWVGKAEKNLDAMLKKCNKIYEEQHIKVLAFVDEAEQMFRSRGTSVGHGVIDRMVNVWLRYMDGMENNEGIIFAAATNRIEMIDEAAKRAGRFDYIIQIPKPDRVGVEDILKKQVAYKERMAKRDIYMIHDYGKLADMLHKKEVNGADIAEILRITSENQIRRFIDMPQEQLIKPEELPILQHRIEEAIQEYTPADRKMQKSRIGFGGQ
ncbi:ATP-binding protein [Candidatus Woesearchaeota archaeon]|nr:ATP-binding protein [Candidatus Woesearchaeota archaeon]